MRDNLPKVLVVSTNAWRDNTGINTLIEFFRCWNPNKLAQVYMKADLPRTNVCRSFFRISENAVLKSVVNHRLSTGHQVQNEQTVSSEDQNAIAEEKKLYSRAGKRMSFLLSICREFVWFFGKWKTEELNNFLDEFNPDVLFIPIYPTIYMGRIQKYIIDCTQKPVVSYIADDNYSFKSISKNPLALIHRLFLRKYVRYIISKSSTLMVISPKQKEEYDKLFGVNSVVMTKGIDFSAIPYEERPLNTPIKMVYTGKLIIGRDKALASISEVMGKINVASTRVELDIYTTDVLSEKQKRMLNRNGCCIKGALTLEQVQEVQSKADILVFVESLEKAHKHTARLSFSTKITDYLKSGKCIFAVGDRDIAPIDYFDRYDSAITATTYAEIGEKLEMLINNPKKVTEYGRKAYNCGKNKHEMKYMNDLLWRTIISACPSERST